MRRRTRFARQRPDLGPVISLALRTELLNNGWGLLGTSSATVVDVPAPREAGKLNEPLRRALLRARLREDDIAARLGVDPKTVRRWLDGRIPYANNRAALADLVGADEADLWPDAGGPLTARGRPEELGTVYPHRWSVPFETWKRFFASAEREIDILTYSALFLAEDASILRILAGKGGAGVKVKIALGDPDSLYAAERNEEKEFDDAMPTKVRNALALYTPLSKIENIEIRLHQAVLYNSLYRADAQLFVNQHTYGIPAARAPIFCFRESESGDIVAAYLNSFERLWTTAEPIQS
jgi:transcriptional regulator with XRE-family HTH domain